MNTIMSLGMLTVTMLVSILVTYPDFPVLELVLLNGAVATIAPIVFYPISRMFWTAVDIAMRPLGPEEVDWTLVAGEGIVGRSEDPGSGSGRSGEPGRG